MILNACNQVYLAAAADSGGDLTRNGGIYFDDMKASKANPITDDLQLAKDLWDVSSKLTKVTYPLTTPSK